MRVGLCLFFNYPFPKNFPTLRKIYSEHFDEIRFIQPMVESSDTDVFTVYRAAFNFSGFFSDARHFLKEMNCDAIVFAGDDCVVNRELTGNKFESTFGDPSADFDMFITGLNQFSGPEWWKNTQKVRAVGRIFGQSGFFDQRIIKWQSYFPDKNWLESQLAAYGLNNDLLEAPTAEEMGTLPIDQAFILNGFFGGQKKRPIPYPLVYAISDFFIISASVLDKFCHNAGIFAALNVFSEFSVPTAMLCTGSHIKQARDVGLKVDWTFGNNPKAKHFVPLSLDEVNNFIDDMGDTLLYRHPVKLSSVQY